MIEKTLEFRGIPLNHFIDYFLELDGEKKTSTFPIMIKGLNWCAEILEEKEIKITSTFIVNAVFISFKAETEKDLEMIISNYRKKTFRAGG